MVVAVKNYWPQNLYWQVADTDNCGRTRIARNTHLREDLQKQECLSELEREQSRQWNLIYQNAKFCNRENLIQMVIKKLHEHHAIAIAGYEGYGKSTMLSGMAVALDKHNQIVIPVKCGSSSNLKTPIGVMKYIVEIMESILNVKRNLSESGESSFSFWRKRFNELIVLYKKDGLENLVFLIDDFDKLHRSEAETFETLIPYELNSKCCMIVTCSAKELLPKRVYREEIQQLDFYERIIMIKELLKFHGKELDSSVILQLAIKKESSNPRYISLALDRLLMLNRDDFKEIDDEEDMTITKKLNSIVENLPVTLRDLYLEITAIVCRNLDNDFVMTMLQYIAETQYGLRESDLEHIFAIEEKKWQSVVFYEFVYQLHSFFLLRDDGRYDFVSSNLREIFVKNADEKHLHRTLLKHLDNLSKEDLIRKQEYLIQAMYAGDIESFAKYISDNQGDEEIIRISAEEITYFLRGNDAMSLLDFLSKADIFCVLNTNFIHHNALADFFSLHVSEIPYLIETKLDSVILDICRKGMAIENSPDALFNLIRAAKRKGEDYIKAGNLDSLMNAEKY